MYQEVKLVCPEHWYVTVISDVLFDKAIYM